MPRDFGDPTADRPGPANVRIQPDQPLAEVIPRPAAVLHREQPAADSTFPDLVRAVWVVYWALVTAMLAVLLVNLIRLYGPPSADRRSFLASPTMVRL